MDQVEIDNIGKVFDLIRRQPAGQKPAAVSFTFRNEEYQAKKEECVSRGAHTRGAVCFSGSKHRVSRNLTFAGLPASLATSQCEEPLVPPEHMSQPAHSVAPMYCSKALRLTIMCSSDPGVFMR